MNNNHYYTPNPDTVHDEMTWNFNLLGREFTFTTDTNVFSKRTVDYGSRTLLEAFRADNVPSGDWLDLGCGYGPIGLALAAHYQDRIVDMVDVNERALALAERNASSNNIHNVNVFTSDRYANVTKKYAAILTNPPVRAGKEIVNDMLSGAKDHLVAGGTLTVVLQKKQGAPSAKQLMTDVFGNCEIIKKDKGYYILEAINGEG